MAFRATSGGAAAISEDPGTREQEGSGVGASGVVWPGAMVGTPAGGGVGVIGADVGASGVVWFGAIVGTPAGEAVGVGLSPSLLQAMTDVTTTVIKNADQYLIIITNPSKAEHFQVHDVSTGKQRRQLPPCPVNRK